MYISLKNKFIASLYTSFANYMYIHNFEYIRRQTTINHCFYSVANPILLFTYNRCENDNYAKILTAQVFTATGWIVLNFP